MRTIQGEKVMAFKRKLKVPAVILRYKNNIPVIACFHVPGLPFTLYRCIFPSCNKVHLHGADKGIFHRVGKDCYCPENEHGYYLQAVSEIEKAGDIREGLKKLSFKYVIDRTLIKKLADIFQK